MKRLTIVLVFALAFVQGLQAQELKIISFNVRYNSWNNIDGENGWPYRKAAVARMINEERPAAIGLQEALIDQLQYLDSCLPTYKRVGVGRDDGKEAGEFMAIYYDTTQLELDIDAHTFWLSETPLVPSLGWDAACRRTVTTAFFRVRGSNRVFCYLNTHLDHMGKEARRLGTRMIAALIKSDKGDWVLCGPNIPVIVGGDMNSTIEDTIFNAFYNEGLKVARDMPQNTSHADTYNAFGKSKGAMIDHFFVRRMKVKQFRTLDGDYGVPYISDHYPIEVAILL